MTDEQVAKITPGSTVLIATAFSDREAVLQGEFGPRKWSVIYPGNVPATVSSISILGPKFPKEPARPSLESLLGRPVRGRRTGSTAIFVGSLSRSTGADGKPVWWVYAPAFSDYFPVDPDSIEPVDEPAPAIPPPVNRVGFLAGATEEQQGRVGAWFNEPQTFQSYKVSDIAVTLDGEAIKPAPSTWASNSVKLERANALLTKVMNHLHDCNSCQGGIEMKALPVKEGRERVALLNEIMRVLNPGKASK